MLLTIPQFNGYLRRMGEVSEMESGNRDHLAFVKRNASRNKGGRSGVVNTRSIGRRYQGAARLAGQRLEAS